jgi:tRNA-2-methylthio-N6-dimethylallyladenosine synthase
MRRGYSCEEYLSRLRRLRERCPQVVLSTDIIVGFPGETEEEFEDTLELLRQLEYDEIFSFMYSPRPQTVSAKIYEDDVSDCVKRDRLQRVLTLQHGISLRKNRQKIGEIEEILVEGRSKLKNSHMMGRTRANRIVNFSGEDALVGTMVRVRITAATAISLVGEPLTAAPVLNSHVEGEMA